MAEITQIGIKVVVDDSQAKKSLEHINVQVATLEQAHVNLGKSAEASAKTQAAAAAKAEAANKDLAQSVAHAEKNARALQVAERKASDEKIANMQKATNAFAGIREATALTRKETVLAESAYKKMFDTLERQAITSAAAKEKALAREVAAKEKAIAKEIALQEAATKKVEVEATKAALANEKLAKTTHLASTAYTGLNANIGKSAIVMAQFAGVTNRTNATLGILVNNISYMIAGTFAMRAIVQATDNFSKFNSQLRLATDSSAEFAKVQTAMVGIAMENRVEVIGLTKVYGALVSTMGALGGTSNDTLKVVDLFSKALQLSSPTATEASAATLQFAQAMGAGVLRGEEFNSIMENGRGVAQKLADGLGVPIGALRAMAEAGALTSEVVINAMFAQEDAIRKDYASIEITISSALTRLRTAGMMWVGTADETAGASKALATAISEVAYGFIFVTEHIDRYVLASNFAQASTSKAAEAAGDLSEKLNMGEILTTAAKLTYSLGTAFDKVSLTVGTLYASMFMLANLDMAGYRSVQDDAVKQNALLTEQLRQFVLKLDDVTEAQNRNLTVGGMLLEQEKGLGGQLEQLFNQTTAFGLSIEEVSDLLYGQALAHKENTKETENAKKATYNHLKSVSDLDFELKKLSMTTKEIIALESYLASIRGGSTEDEAWETSTRNAWLQEEKEALKETETVKKDAEANQKKRDGDAKQQAADARAYQLDQEKQWSADLLAFYQEEQDEKTKIAEATENLRTNLANDRYDAEVALWDAEKELLGDTAKLADSVGDYGDSWTRTGNQAVDAMGSMMASMAKVSKDEAKIAKQKALFRTDEAKTSKEYQSLLKAERDVSVKGSMDMLAASISMFEEGSAAQELAHKAYLAMQVAELAATAPKVIMDGVAAVMAQGKGDPYTAIPRMVAMGAMVAATLSQVGLAFGGVSGASSASYSQVQQSEYSVLGGGESAAWENFTQKLIDVGADQYSELRQINDNTRFLNQALAQATGALYSTGDITGLSTDLSSYKQGGFQDLMDMAMGNPIGDLVAQIPVVGALFEGLGGLVGNIGNAIFGGGTTRTSTGYGVSLGGSLDDPTASGYQSIKKRTDGGWFGSSKTSYYDIYSEVDAQVTDAISKTFDYVGDSLVNIGDLLGQSVVDEMSGLAISVGKIDLTGKTSAEVQEALTAAINVQTDKWAYELFDEVINTYQKLNESAFDTLTRLVVEKVVVEDILKTTGQDVGTVDKIGFVFQAGKLKFVNLGEFEADALAVTQSLIGITGSLEALSDAASTYYDLFFSDAEKLERNYGRLTDVLAEQNVALPATRDAYRSLVEALNLGTESGQKAYVALLGVSELADEYYSNLEDKGVDALNALADAFANFEGQAGTLKEQLLALIDADALLAYQREKQLAETDDLLKSTQRNVWLLQDAKVAQDNYNSALTTAASYLTGVFKSIRSFTSGLLITSALSASTAFAGQLELARGGNVDALGGITQSAGTYLDMSKREATSLVDYQRTMAETINSMHGLEKALTPEQFLADEISKSLIEQTLALLGGEATLKTDLLTAFSTLGVESLTAEQIQAALAGNASSADIAALIANADTNADGAITAMEAVEATTDPLSLMAEYQLSMLDGIWESSSLQVNALGVLNTSINSLTNAMLLVAAQDNPQSIPIPYPISIPFPIPTPPPLPRPVIMPLLEMVVKAAEDAANMASTSIGGSFAVGTNYVPNDMLAQIHKGEMIVPAKFNPITSGLGGNGNTAILSELRALRSEISELRQQDRRAAFEIVKAQKDTRDIIEQWNFDGMPQVRT